MKDFAKSVRTNNADLGLRPVVPQLVKDIAKIYEDNGKDREKTKQELIQKHHMSERQAEDVLRQIIGNSKVGNYILNLMDQANEYSKGFSEALKKGDKAEARKFAAKVGNESIDKQEWSMFNGLRKDAENEIGNATGDEYNAEIQRLTKKAEQLRRMGQGRQAMEVEKQIEKLGKELRELGNKKTGNEFDFETQHLMRLQDEYKYLQKNLQDAEYDLNKHKGDKYWEELYKAAQRDLQRAKENLERAKKHKTGNAGHWNATKTMYGKWDDKTGRPAEEYARITWLGEGKGGVVNIWNGHQMTSEKYGSNNLEDLRKWAEQRIGNEETKAERKFGKVMGEFEEGALKTPQGKTVTDPAQAKAIAYSEADKVDNLKRARNAMKK